MTVTQCLRCLRTQSARAGTVGNNTARNFHSSPNRQTGADPKAIAEAFLSKFANGQTFVRKQYLDANQLRLFSLTLDRPHLWPKSTVSTTKSLEESEPSEGTPIPPGYHLAYFTPAQLPGILGLDGTDASFNPETPFTRRMWAGGSVEWPGADPSQTNNHYLKVGEHATEVTKVLSCEVKTIKKTGDLMLVVGVEKEFRDHRDNICVVDKRNWVFREALDPSKPAKIPKKPATLSQTELDSRSQGKITRSYTRDPVVLFRFSALTFNAHKIHYDKPWAQNVEGHRDVVVHGPLNLITMLDMWRDETVSPRAGNTQDGIVYPHKIEYRATSPVYAGEQYQVLMDEDAARQKGAELVVMSNDGTTCMKGSVAGW